jgi:hypothetical protein
MTESTQAVRNLSKAIEKLRGKTITISYCANPPFQYRPLKDQIGESEDQ